MKITISGIHMDIGESLNSHINSQLTEEGHKYFERPINSSVTITKEKNHLFTTDILMNEGTGTGILIKASAHDSDAYKSFDQALSKTTQQLKKHKTRLKNHHKVNPNKMVYMEAKKFVIPAVSDDGDDFYGDAPTIIAEKISEIEKLSVGDAVMKMDLQNLSAYIFVNASTNRTNVLHYREDGNIAWIDVPNA